ncbi:hypothetical protein L9F63_018395 [Diploptera punctata]|uniref:Uncharacterized protein n=1 Tax=Diploptera punctata TaxID=6984 RepID=A0AAD7ZWZ9_DIPPU|nr:hypothetical protein L9F63_018395 [Diploptera punctata]
MFSQSLDENIKDDLKQFWPYYHYNPCVLVGNWFEERSRYLQPILERKSTYDTDYVRPYPTLDPNPLADNINKNHGIGPEIQIEHGGTDYYNNYSTSYDLHYQHCPKRLSGPQQRIFNSQRKIYEPEQDYTVNYGNASNYGISEEKKQQWYDELFNWKIFSTEYRDAYPTHDNKDRIVKRIAVPRKFSSKLCEINKTNSNFRGNKLGVVPDIPIQIPRKLSCGPQSAYVLSPACKQ